MAWEKPSPWSIPTRDAGLSEIVLGVLLMDSKAPIPGRIGFRRYPDSSRKGAKTGFALFLVNTLPAAAGAMVGTGPPLLVSAPRNAGTTAPPAAPLSMKLVVAAETVAISFSPPGVVPR